MARVFIIERSYGHEGDSVQAVRYAVSEAKLCAEELIISAGYTGEIDWKPCPNPGALRTECGEIDCTVFLGDIGCTWAITEWETNPQNDAQDMKEVPIEITETVQQ